ncbi:NUDIX hydrolase [Legionella beliardensis]|uniref:ADP-ribose pyrophosphatase n=1 Tax=Legionella beliardensis TaxID=91822 RepID=A0A378I1S6_9GAMM|nr:NUDIX hydrolase [Legionella beliardensis]STX28953.1 NUDIX hydrolase [Legionella beliardensis]
MNKKVKIINQQTLHDGYLKISKLSLKVPSLSSQKDYIAINDREVINTNDSVSVLLYVPAKDSFILCQQFRVGVFLNKIEDDCFTLECVAGNIDKAECPKKAAYREVKEETGIEIKDIQLIATVYKSPGLLTEKNYLFYAEVNELPSCKLHGVDDEEIMTHVIKREKVYQLMDGMQLIDAATVLALNWFHAKRHQ